MNEEEKAEEIANERCRELMCYGSCNIRKNHHCGYWHYNYECALKGIEYGLAEGRKELESVIRFRILSRNVDKQTEDKDEKESLRIEYCKECFISFMDNLP